MAEANLHAYQAGVDKALSDLVEQNIVQRIWDHDHTVWRPDPDEIANRLGWLDIADAMRDLYGPDTNDVVAGDAARAWSTVGTITGLVDAVRADGYTHALLLGMGGSSLAPEVFRKTFGVADGYLDLDVLDSTDPGAILNYDRQLDPAKTLYIMSTKSGGTVETLSFFKYFYNQMVDAVGEDAAGAHFIAITDPGSSLEKLAGQYAFRATFLNDPNIGGRYSALSYFGLVPAALIGVDVPQLLQRAVAAEQAYQKNSVDNLGLWLGAILGTLAKAGRDKVTFITSPTIASFGDWVEQLIAESTGKEGKGILPVVGEPVAKNYSADRLFVYLYVKGEDNQRSRVDALAAQHPVIQWSLFDLYDLGEQCFLWEFAVAVAGQQIDIQPFDQPNVESAKIIARDMVAAYMESGKLPQQKALLTEKGVTVYADVRGNSLAAVTTAFLAQATPGDYIALQAYVTPSPAMDDQLQELRKRLLDQTGLATTLGYGPRFLHSTGQLHKGDAGNGLFIQFTSDTNDDINIPDQAGQAKSTMPFGVLKLAQALGDRAALLENNRRVITFHLGTDVTAGLDAIRSVL